MPDPAAGTGPGGALGRLLRALREQRLLTQAELASRAGVSVGTIAGLETGRTRRPRSGSLRLLADALELTGADRAALYAAYRPEPAAGAGTGPPPGARPVVPAQLPAAPAHFTDREEHLRRLDRLLPDDPRAVTPTALTAVITGTAGIGKTALAVHWAHRVRHRFPDGQLHVDLRGYDPVAEPMEPGEAVRGFLEALGIAPQHQPSSPQAQVGAYRSLLAGRRMLVVLDNARDTDQVRPLLPGAPGCLALVTSRTALPGLVAAADAHPVPLDLFPVEPARQLLARRLGERRVGAEPEAVDALIAGCARLPLALVIVAARAAARPEFPLRELAAELRAGAGLDPFAAGEDSADLRAALSWSYRRLDAATAALFRLLGLPAGPELGVAAAASLGGLTPGQASRHLAELVGLHLVTEPRPGRYALHDLVRAYAAELAAGGLDPAARAAARRRLLDHYLHTGFAAATLISPERDPIPLPPPPPELTCPAPADRQQAMAWFATEQPALLAEIGHAAEPGFDAYAWRLTWVIAPVLHRRGSFHEQIAVHTRALAAARRLGDRLGEAHIQHGLAGGYARAGRYPRARTHYRRARAGFEEVGDAAGQATVLLGIGSVAERQGRHLEALAYARRALALFRAAGHDGGQARARNNVGWQHARLGEYRQALTHCQEALALHRAVGDARGEAIAWDSLGFAHHRLGDTARALECYQRALGLFRELADRLNEADTLVRLGEVHAEGDPAAGRATWRRALAILDELGHPDADQVRARL